MRQIFPAFLLLAACSGGQSNEEALQNAAEQSDPAAAAALNNAAAAGTDPQQALNEAGQAQLGNDAQPDSSLHARPNLPQAPNRKDGTQPPDKVDVNAQ
jgi:hypothetical protein